MNTSVVKYQGELRTEMTHLASNSKVITDAPVDNHGKGQSFSPTDLVATALASCALTIMGISARAHDFELGPTEAEVLKIMAADPRRIGQIDIVFRFLSPYTDKQKLLLEKAAKTCPVAKSLDPALVQNMQFVFQD